MEQILDRLCSHLDKNNYKYDRTETVSGCGAVRVRFRAHNLDMVELSYQESGRCRNSVDSSGCH